MQRAAEGARELAVGHGLGRAGVDRALPARAVDRGEVEADDVVGVDPRHVLATTGDGPPDAEAEERQHLGQRAALLVQRHARPQHGHPQPVLGGAGGLALPRDADLGQEVVAGGGVLGDPLVAARPVVADGRGADQRRGAGSAAAMPATRLRVPISRESRIADRDSSVQRWATFSPARWTTASRPLSAAAGAGSCSGRQACASTSPRAARARSGSRESTVTASPRSRSRLTIAVPRRPVAPVSVTFMGWVRRRRVQGPSSCGRPSAGPHPLSVDGREADGVAGGHRGALLLGLLGHGGGHRGRHVAVEDRGDDVVLAQLGLGDDPGDGRARRPSSSPR